MRGPHVGRRSLSATARLLAPGLLALAFLIQNYAAERHFHPLVLSPPVAHGTANYGAFIAKPPLPAPDQQQEDECPLCQVLGLGATMDVPHLAVLFPPVEAVDLGVLPSWETASRYFFAPNHSPRGPPSPLPRA